MSGPPGEQRTISLILAGSALEEGGNLSAQEIEAIGNELNISNYSGCYHDKDGYLISCIVSAIQVAVFFTISKNFNAIYILGIKQLTFDHRDPAWIPLKTSTHTLDTMLRLAKQLGAPSANSLALVESLRNRSKK